MVKHLQSDRRRRRGQVDAFRRMSAVMGGRIEEFTAGGEPWNESEQPYRESELAFGAERMLIVDACLA